jgi:serine/threonine-protein kinase
MPLGAMTPSPAHKMGDSSGALIYATGGCVAAGLLAGCGGSQRPIGAPVAEKSLQRMIPEQILEPPSLQEPLPLASAPTYDVSAPLLYVTNTTADHNDVKVYHANAKDPGPIAVITDGIEFPIGDCIDGEGTLYVTNLGTGVGFVSEYAAGKTTLSRIVTKGINVPVYCAIDSAGNLWVTDLGNSSVTEYKNGSTKLSTTITEGVTDPHGIAFDHSGNMYVSDYLGDYESNVAVYAPGHKSPSRTITDGLTTAEGVAVDANGTLYVANDGGCNVEEYLAGKDHPYQEITTDINGPTGLTVGKNGLLYVVNTGYQGCDGDGPANVILEFPDGSLTPSAKEVSKGVYTPEGSAYDPPMLP